MCRTQLVLCAAFSLCYVQPLVGMMCRLQSVLCKVFGLCYVQSSVCVKCSLYSVLCAVFRLFMCSIQCPWLAAKAARRCAPDSCR